MSNRWMKVIGLLILCAAPPLARGAEPLCPGRRGHARPRARCTRCGLATARVGSRSTHATFVLPDRRRDRSGEPAPGVRDRGRSPAHRNDDAGRRQARLATAEGGASRTGTATRDVALGHARGGYRLVGRSSATSTWRRSISPTRRRFLKQILKIGDDCFSAVLACTGKANGLVCKPERTVLLAGRVERSGHAPLPGAMVTLIDDAAPRDASRSSPRRTGATSSRALRPGPYRLRARLIGYEDAVQADVVARQGPRPRASRFTMAPTANTNDQLPASAWFSLILDKWPDPKIRGRLHALVRQLPPDRELPLPPRQDRGAVAGRPDAHDDQPAAVLPGDARCAHPERDRHVRTERDLPDAAGPAAAVGRGAERRHLRVHPRQRDQQPRLPRPRARRRQPRLRGRRAALDRSAHERARRLSRSSAARTRSSAARTATCGSRRRAATASPRSTSTASRSAVLPAAAASATIRARIRTRCASTRTARSG